MKVFGFMVPADKVVSCQIGCSLKVALDEMLEKKIGAIVVLDDSADKTKAAGLLTKSDLLQAYQKNLSLEKMVVEDVMSKHLYCLSKDMNKDEAAKVGQLPIYE